MVAVVEAFDDCDDNYHEAVMIVVMMVVMVMVMVIAHSGVGGNHDGVIL